MDSVVADIRPRLLRPQQSQVRIEDLLLRLCSAVEELLALQRQRGSGGEAGRAAARPPISAVALESLSPAEQALLSSVLEGLSNKEIAARRSTSVKTVKGQLTGVYRKLNVSGRGRLLARCRSSG